MWKKLPIRGSFPVRAYFFSRHPDKYFFRLPYVSDHAIRISHLPGGSFSHPPIPLSHRPNTTPSTPLTFRQILIKRQSDQGYRKSRNILPSQKKRKGVCHEAARGIRKKGFLSSFLPEDSGLWNRKQNKGTVLMAKLKNCEEGYSHIPVGNIRGASTH